MPQLDFTWWMINFLVIWITIMMIFILLITNPMMKNHTTTQTKITKTTNNWQWF